MQRRVDFSLLCLHQETVLRDATLQVAREDVIATQPVRSLVTAVLTLMPCASVHLSTTSLE